MVPEQLARLEESLLNFAADRNAAQKVSADV